MIWPGAQVESQQFFYDVGEETAGEAQLQSDGGIWAVEIYRKYRGKGHGRRLMEQLLAEARRRGYTRVWLYVQPDNYVARWLYASMGFECLAETPRGLLVELTL
jgi:ribosomal protein S18 acetylase RimI-like enzyme